MDLNSPLTLLAAWVLVPALVLVASAGLGTWLALAAGRPLGPLVLPAGFLAGMVVISLLLQAGASGPLTVIAAAALAVAGLAAAVLRRRSGAPRASREWAAALAAGTAAYAVGLAPLAGSGRSGVLGYVLNNDPTIHLSVVELLRRYGTDVPDLGASSFHAVGGLFGNGYPLGSYAWPLFGRVLTGVDPFHLWTPLIALALGLLAVVMFSALRSLGASRLVAGVGAMAVGCGYLPLSYLAQGGAKEVEAALAIYAAIVLATHFGSRAGPRTFLPAAIATVAAVYVFGLAALAYLGPAAVAVAVIVAVVAPPARRRRLLAGYAAAAAVGVVVALPALVAAIRFARDNQSAIVDPAQVGNLIGPVPWVEAFNVWLSADYRVAIPELALLTKLGLAVAAALAAVGLAAAVRRRAPLVPLAVGSAVIGTGAIASRFAIYFDVKAFMIMAPALGLASTAGAAALIASRRRWARSAGLAAGGAFVIGVLGSAAMVYSGAWVTPEQRFEELAEIADRVEGRGPVLVHEREQYGFYLLRDARPWESWGAWQPERGIRIAGGHPPMPKTPDFDDYDPAYFHRFPLLVERRRPGGSLPPGNYEIEFETLHYRVWRRSGPPPEVHLPLGSETVVGVSTLECAAPEIGALRQRARQEGRPLRVAHGQADMVVSDPKQWSVLNRDTAALPGFVGGQGGLAVLDPPLARGSYDVFAQGSFGPGFRLHLGQRKVGEVFGDLGLHDAWHPVGEVEVAQPNPTLIITGLDKPFWQSGSRRGDLLGPLAFVDRSRPPRVEEVSARGLSRLCGQPLDWIELP